MLSSKVVSNNIVLYLKKFNDKCIILKRYHFILLYNYKKLYLYLLKL